MAFPNVDTQFKPGQSGNPAGKPKGAIHLSTHIQNLLNDPDFLPEDAEGNKVIPIKAIIKTALIKAREGDQRWADWLAKYGYGQKFELEHSGEVNTGTHDPALAEKFSDYLKNETKK
jgi:hypothetical protein